VDLLLLVVLGAVAMLGWKVWLQQRAAQALALAYLRRECKKQGFQLLDDTVALTRTRLQLRQKRLLVLRTLAFEFSSDGADRYRGELMLTGQRVTLISGFPVARQWAE
tara:strand:- start:4396 stop:4719 length:324 start_codon:yes stop_codon:yes gene_type:complete